MFYKSSIEKKIKNCNIFFSGSSTMKQTSEYDKREADSQTEQTSGWLPLGRGKKGGAK